MYETKSVKVHSKALLLMHEVKKCFGERYLYPRSLKVTSFPRVLLWMSYLNRNIEQNVRKGCFWASHIASISLKYTVLTDFISHGEMEFPCKCKYGLSIHGHCLLKYPNLK